MYPTYGTRTLMSLQIGRLGEVRKDYSPRYRLNDPDGARVQLFFERGTDIRFRQYTARNAAFQTPPDAKEYKWSLAVVDFNGHSSVQLQIRAWLQSSKDFRYFLEHENSWTAVFPSDSHKNFKKTIDNQVEEWEDLEFCVEVRPLIVKPVAIEKPLVVEKLVLVDENSKLSEHLANSFKNEKCANVTVKVGDQTFKVSEFMLRTRSDVFEAMFAHETEEQKSKLIEIKNAKPEIVEKMLEFIYTSKVDDLKLTAADLLPLADQYQLKELCDKCADQMCGDLKVETIMEQLQLVALYDHLTDFKTRVLNFGKKNLNQICKLPGWKEFGEKNVHIVLDLLPTSN